MIGVSFMKSSACLTSEGDNLHGEAHSFHADENLAQDSHVNHEAENEGGGQEEGRKKSRSQEMEEGRIPLSMEAEVSQREEEKEEKSMMQKPKEKGGREVGESTLQEGHFPPSYVWIHDINAYTTSHIHRKGEDVEGGEELPCPSLEHQGERGLLLHKDFLPIVQRRIAHYAQ
jgi:hypothetical protein